MFGACSDPFERTNIQTGSLLHVGGMRCGCTGEDAATFAATVRHPSPVTMGVSIPDTVAPIAATTATSTAAMPPAMSAYSMAVVPARADLKCVSVSTNGLRRMGLHPVGMGS